MKANAVNDVVNARVAGAGFLYSLLIGVTMHSVHVHSQGQKKNFGA